MHFAFPTSRPQYMRERVANCSIHLIKMTRALSSYIKEIIAIKNNAQKKVIEEMIHKTREFL